MDGSKIEIKANTLELSNGSSVVHLEVGSFINCGSSHGDTICTVTRVQVEEIENRDGTFRENKIVLAVVVGSLDQK